MSVLRIVVERDGDGFREIAERREPCCHRGDRWLTNGGDDDDQAPRVVERDGAPMLERALGAGGGPGARWEVDDVDACPGCEAPVEIVLTNG